MDQLPLFISLIFLITLGSLSLSHSARRILSCIFSRVSLSIFANSADISSILFLRSSSSFSLFFNFSSCYFFVSAIVSLFFSIFKQNYSILPLFRRAAVPAIPIHRCTLSAFACTDGSWLILVIFVVHYCHHFFLFCFEISIQVHDSLFDLVLACPILVRSLLLEHYLRSNLPSCFCKSCTLLFRI